MSCLLVFMTVINLNYPVGIEAIFSNSLASSKSRLINLVTFCMAKSYFSLAIEFCS
ncbi:hypothetical protein SVI_1672 [Shewanella violacea DSS12]|uniref:Uncharacterized protein n=1 Tax=Shewanella violacea (strain JCM 10179 / CIP 106290 / LMG 19151 / DSS12) TaxID=637905 RepID=D4ZIZ4_SHEVD|nr:hypothetical protein SVI_1672 [Shewanella violacea DSS12]